jgi:hypothetical protein
MLLAARGQGRGQQVDLRDAVAAFTQAGRELGLLA